MMMADNNSSQLTFAQMSKRNITAKDLLSWSASIDLVERYQSYLETPNTFSMSEFYNNCTALWFGPICQYTFDSDQSFSDIVTAIFISKEMDIISDVNLDMMNLSCYALIECNRGPPPACLDWREICDGTVDCIDGIDEIDCFELEINECENNEYRCHQGMCIPERFINDNPYNPDCLDSSDENEYKEQLDDIDIGPVFNSYTLGTEYPKCFQDPSFRCEDTNHRLKYFTQNSVCGDGQPSILHLPHKLDKYINNFQDRYACRNKRVQMLEESFVWYSQYTNLTYECWSAMMCLTYIPSDMYYTDECLELVQERDDSDYISIQSRCTHADYIIFPEFPIIQGHVRLGYWTNKTFLFEGFGLFLRPDIVCYDVQRCTFLPFTVKINNLTCIEIDRLPVTYLLELTDFFRACNYIYQSGNETDCLHTSLFHCPGTSKCISKHRLLDGIHDCYNDTDEIYEDSCQLNDKHRFHCSSKNKCIASYAVRDGIRNCPNDEDEVSKKKQGIMSFQTLCNGYTYLSPIFIDGQNETDETNCEQWPCNNQYTRCDGAWTCSDGADEINCDKNSKCYPDSHECISPRNFQIICLPLNRTGNGIIDCLGSTDERKYCRDMYPLDVENRYRCWNDRLCRSWIGNPADVFHLATSYCGNEVNFFFNQPDSVSIQNTPIVLNMASVLNRLLADKILIDNDNLNQIHFYLDYADHLLSNTNDQMLSTTKQSVISVQEIDFRENSNCNRGILIRIGQNKMEYCLCPPSYYGNLCQFQSQRISLTLQFVKECTPDCRGTYAIILTLIDSNRVIHSYEQITYITTRNCDIKHNFYFLYGSRPKDLTTNYSIHIDVYNKIDLTYSMSWIIPIRFLFLPVNRISTHLIISSHRVGIIEHCQLNCGDYGHCRMYANTGEYFCHCHPYWSGADCTIRQDDCNCSSSSVCIGIVNHRSICLCPPNKVGPRCFLSSACQDNPCHNGGQCIPEDDRWLINHFTCVCPNGYVGKTCEERNMRIDISFHHVEIPQALLIHFITVQMKADPLITTISKRISLNEDTATVYTSMLHNMIFVQIDSEYYLSFVQAKAIHISQNGIKVKSSDYCPSIHKLLDKRTAAFSLLRRAKFYHIPCKENLQLSCFHDSESFICLCNKERHANCFPFHFNNKSTCFGGTHCENGGHCIADLPTCPTTTMCVCAECYYGAKCQLTTKGSGLSLDVIFGYQIRQHIPIYRQSTVVKISIGVTKFLLFIGLISGTLSTLTFRSKTVHEVGCGLYLYVLSIISLFTVIIFTLKLWFLIFFQTSWITDRTAQKISCISIEFILQSLVTIEDWLSVCVSIERAWLVRRCDNSSKRKSVKIARWIIAGVMLGCMVSFIHDPIYRRLIDDQEEQRLWCVIQYPYSAKLYDSVIRIFHFVIPFFANLISTLAIIFFVARTHSTARKNKTYKQHLCEQFSERKHLIISPIILVILAVPRLIISFLSSCMKSVRNPWLFLCGYYISFIPPLLTSVIFIIPSRVYTTELMKILKRCRHF